MTGYRRVRKLYTLRWNEGHELHGLEVVTRGLSVEKLTGMARLIADISGLQPAFDAGQATLANLDTVTEGAKQLFEVFAAHLVSWNLEDDDGQPVPATYEAIDAMDDLPFMKDLILTWMEAVASVDTPLPQGSANGASPAPEASLPMEPLLPSPSS